MTAALTHALALAAGAVVGACCAWWCRAMLATERPPNRRRATCKRRSDGAGAQVLAAELRELRARRPVR